MLEVLKEVGQERSRQHDKWGVQNRNAIEWIAILTEEVGEASKEAVDMHILGIDPDEKLKNFRMEMIQIAAVAVQIVENIDRNRLKK